mgnify:CR=1 FL=1
MTAIVGLVDEKTGKIYLGGDSAGVDSGYRIQLRKDTKVFRNGPFLIGYTSSFRMGQLIRFSLRPARRYPETDIYEYMCTTFIEGIRGVLKEGGYTKVDNNRESGGAFLVGYEGRLFEIQSDFQVAESLDNYNACGCGFELALSSLYTTKELEYEDPYERVLLALQAAARYSGGVSAPFVIETLDFGKETT